MNPTLLGALKSKTVWLNVIGTGVEIAQYVSPFMPPQYHTAFVIGMGVGNLIMRKLTTKPLEEK